MNTLDLVITLASALVIVEQAAAQDWDDEAKQAIIDRCRREMGATAQPR